MTREGYIKLLSDLLSKDPDAKERERRVREANQKLYLTVVPGATTTQADLVLAAAALRERERRLR